MSLIAVAVPVPFLDLLTYRVPEPLPIPPVGARVRVPLGRRILTGVVVQAAASAPEGTEIRDVAEILDREPFLPPAVVELCCWMADYYMAGIGDALAAALPPGAQTRASSFKTRRIVAATAHGLAAAAGAAPVHGEAGTADGGNGGRPERPLGSSQLAALHALTAAPAGLAASQMRELGFDSGVIARLVSRGLAVVRREHDDRDPFENAAPAPAPDAARALTTEQDSAVRRLVALAGAGEFRVALLHGVTGSGKTEIYLRLAGVVARSGRQVLVLVPEIALTPAVAAQFRGAFGARVAVQHSGLSGGERHDQWQRIRRGEVDVVVGTRSAVFAPLSNPGLVVVDEEHDASYKQEESPRYHGRDVAVMRGSRAAALVVLGSATPSMETYQNALAGKYERIALETRVMGRPLAGVTLVNMRDEYAAVGPDIVVSRELAAGIEDRLARREQVLVLLNRRGYATAVFCRQCGDTFECPNCSVSLTLHTGRGGWRTSPGEAPRRLVDGRARCHYCNYSMRVPAQCRACAAPYLEQAGFGTEKVERELRERFPAARIARIDRDSVRRKGALAGLLATFSAGDLDLLVGTQMIAKGHDFARVTLVGVISADVGLGLADFRAAERTFQLLTQVAGRAGRGERSGEALVQTLYPNHYSIQLACRQDYPAFFERELLYRKGLRYPPIVAMVNVVVRGRTFGTAMGDALDLTRRLEPAADSGAFAILGPAPAPLVRLRGEHRVQFFLKGARRAPMRDALRLALAARPDMRRRVSVDVDPLSVL